LSRALVSCIVRQQFSEAPELLRLWNACQICILPVKPLDFDLSLKRRFVSRDFEFSNRAAAGVDEALHRRERSEFA
jgi:hypothetical protein